MNISKLKFLTRLNEDHRDFKEVEKDIIVTGILPEEAEKLRQAFYQYGLDVTPLKNGGFKFSFIDLNSKIAPSDDLFHSIDLDVEHAIEKDYLYYNDKCNGEYCGNKTLDNQDIFSQTIDYGNPDEDILYNDKSQELVNYSFDPNSEYRDYKEEKIEEEPYIDNTDQNYYYNNNLNDLDLSFNDDDKAYEQIIKMSQDFNADENFDEDSITPDIIKEFDTEEKEKHKKQYVTEEIEEYLDEPSYIESLKKLLIHNKEVLLSKDSEKMVEYKSELENLGINELKDIADKEVPNWENYLDRYQENVKKEVEEDKELLTEN